MKAGKIALLLSGGLDSTILTSLLLKSYSSIQPIYFESGHVWETTELFWLKRYLKAIHRVKLKPLVVLNLRTDDLYDGHWSLTGKKAPDAKSNDREVYLPGKNLLLIAKAAVYCSVHQIPTLALGPLKTNPFADAKPSFFKDLEKICGQALGFKFRIKTPFLNRTKNEVMKLGKGLPIHLTFSCLAPKKNLHCGQCNKCYERKKAFRHANITDPTHYAS